MNGDARNISELKSALSGQDIVYCAISGDELPKIASVLVTAMSEAKVKRLIFMGAVGIYNEISDEIDVNFAIQLIQNDNLYLRESISITHIPYHMPALLH